MRKTLIIALVLFYSATAFSQSYSGGLQGGINYSWLSIDSKQGEAKSGRLGFSAGAFFDNNFSDNFSLSLGLNINSIGGTINYYNPIALNWDNEDYKIEEDSEIFFKVKQLDLPISIKGRTQKIGYMTYFARIGMSPSFIIDSKADIVKGIARGSDNKVVADTKDLDISKNLNYFNISWHVGGGFEYNLGGTTAIITEIIFTSNLFNLTDSNITGDGASVGALSNFLIIKTGIKF